MPRKESRKIIKYKNYGIYKEEMAAIIKAAKAMSLADGVMTSDERAVIATDLKCFGIELNTPKSVLLETLANAMEVSDMIIILNKMSVEQKKYVCGYLATVMMADGKIHDKEMALWRLISNLASFPLMEMSEAIQFWHTH